MSLRVKERSRQKEGCPSKSCPPSSRVVVTYRRVRYFWFLLVVYLFVSRTFPTSTSGEERVEEEEEEENPHSNRIESNPIGGVFFGGGCGLCWTTLTVGEKVPRGKR